MEPSKNNIPDTPLEKSDSAVLKGFAQYVGLSGILTCAIAGATAYFLPKKHGKDYYKKYHREPEFAVRHRNAVLVTFQVFAVATVITVGSFSLVLYGLWKWYDFKDFNDFRATVRKYVKKSPPTTERTEFENLSDLINYLSETHQKKKNN